MTHDETKLPKWAQTQIAELRRELEQTRRAHAVLFDYAGWFTLGVNTAERLKLFTCTEDGTHCVCTVGCGDILLVGRSVKVEDHHDHSNP